MHSLQVLIHSTHSATPTIDNSKNRSIHHSAVTLIELKCVSGSSSVFFLQIYFRNIVTNTARVPYVVSWNRRRSKWTPGVAILYYITECMETISECSFCGHRPRCYTTLCSELERTAHGSTGRNNGGKGLNARDFAKGIRFLRLEKLRSKKNRIKKLQSVFLDHNK